jgi:hypothetical protein
MPVVKTRYACPSCGAQVNAEHRKLVCSANNNHSWNDTAVFLGLNPQVKYEESKPPVIVQPNHVKMEVTVPPTAKTRFEAKFGDRGNATVSGLIQMLSEGDVLIVPEADLQRMKELLGKRPESASELFGLVYNLSMELETAKLVADEAKKDVAIYEGRNPGAVLLNMGSLYGAVVEKARDQNETAKIFLERNLKMALENSWF